MSTIRSQSSLEGALGVQSWNSRKFKKHVETSERLQTAGPFPIAPLCGNGVFKLDFYVQTFL